MIEKTTKIINSSGLHARPASDFVRCASRYKSKIMVAKAGTAHFVSAKSILKVLSLTLSQGDEICIQADGEDEQIALDTLIRLVDDGLNE